ncbi:MAG: hypothetical protein ACFE0I_11890 [Elainellaceae cyanobacterium]
MTSLQRHLDEYHVYLNRAIAAVQTLKMTDPNSEEFSDAMAELHVVATVLEPYSEGMVEAIDAYTKTCQTTKPDFATVPCTEKSDYYCVDIDDSFICALRVRRN